MIWPSRTPDLEVQGKLLSLSWVLDIDMVHDNKVTPSVQTRARAGGGGRGECVAIAIVIVSCESREHKQKRNTDVVRGCCWCVVLSS